MKKRKPISETVSGLLKKSGLNLNEVERRTEGELSHSFLSKLLSGSQSNPRLEKFIALAGFFRASATKLLGEEEPAGFRDDKFWKLSELYKQIERPIHRKVVDA